MRPPHILFAVLLSILVSCSGNEHELPENNEPIIGTWKLEKVMNNGADVQEACMDNNKLIALENGNISLETYRTSSPNSPCILVMNSAKWEKTGTNSYQIIYDNSKEVAYITNDRIVIRSSYIETLKTGVEVTVTLETFYTKSN